MTEIEKNRDLIHEVMYNLDGVFCYKNDQYGSSASKPLNIFSEMSAEADILVRLDDKLSRIKHSKELRKNDVVDTIGYLVRLCIIKEWLSFDELKD